MTLSIASVAHGSTGSSSADLELPDGSHLAARVDAEGDAHLPLPASIFTVDPLPTTVRVDGATVQRLLLPRP